ncbi:GNAT family N-acetyltransferase [Microbulbifer pacificus]|uniref:GNAT family N-acetyltransferase n=1 Tax=Microbulbifer pacificus TaxID=407164 RepID=A0AAU0N112_9GAMM|nr:GNAT family N-acetyltransferase [Microbulbifer pacificus]WOX06714.1 GNAT family N-acetyltransferase [Microbulbifer pacificus]
MESDVSTELEPSSSTAAISKEHRRSTAATTTPRIAVTPEGARDLMQLWEQSEDRRTHAPRPANASHDFFLPYIAANDCYLSPHVALWESAGEPTGILIARMAIARPKRTIGPLSVPMPQLKTLEVIHGGLEANDEMTALLQLDYIRDFLASGDVDAVSIHHLPCESETGKLISATFSGPGGCTPVITDHWFTELTDASGKPVVTNTAKNLRNFRRQDRKFEAVFEGKLQIREMNTEKDVIPFIVAATAISQHTYQGSLGIGVRNDKRWHTNLNILAANGQLRGYLLQADDVIVAYAVGGTCRNTFNYLATSFLPEYRELAPGAYLMRRIMERMPDEGVCWFDFGFGNATYKERTGSLCRKEATYYLYGKSRAAWIARRLDGVVQGANRGLRKILTSTNMLDRARRLWRRALERVKQ